MNAGQRIAAMFGAQYVMVRQSHQLTFSCCRAYLIGNRYYVRRTFTPNTMQHRALAPEYKAPHYWLLTNKNRVTTFEEEQPDNDIGATVFTYGIWIPITKEVDAHVRMVEAD